jgi:hypothetical protein
MMTGTCLTVPSSGSVAPRRPDLDMDDFAFIIPLDCKTSMPVASRKHIVAVGLRSKISERSG